MYTVINLTYAMSKNKNDLCIIHAFNKLITKIHKILNATLTPDLNHLTSPYKKVTIRLRHKSDYVNILCIDLFYFYTI